MIAPPKNPTRFLYEASLKTPTALRPNGKEAEMHELTTSEHIGECRICAHETDRGFLSKKVMKKTFTDMDALRRPESEVVCEYCVWALGWSPGLSSRQGGLSTFRLNSIYARPSGVEFPSRMRWREILTSPPMPPYLACVAVSGQKWLHIRGRVSRHRAAHDIMLEQRRVIASPGMLRKALETFEALYAGFPKAQIESGDYDSYRVWKFGEVAEELEVRMQLLRGTDVFRIAAFVAQRPETGEKEERCYTASSPAGKKSQSPLFSSTPST